MRTLSFAVVITTVTVAHADPLENHLQALRGYGVSGPHDATALIGGYGLVRSDRSGRHSTRDDDPIGNFEHELGRPAVIFGIGPLEVDDYMGLSSFAPKYDPADWGNGPDVAGSLQRPRADCGQLSGRAWLFYRTCVEGEARRGLLERRGLVELLDNPSMPP